MAECSHYDVPESGTFTVVRLHVEMMPLQKRNVLQPAHTTIALGLCEDNLWDPPERDRREFEDIILISRSCPCLRRHKIFIVGFPNQSKHACGIER